MTMAASSWRSLPAERLLRCLPSASSVLTLLFRSALSPASLRSPQSPTKSPALSSVLGISMLSMTGLYSLRAWAAPFIATEVLWAYFALSVIFWLITLARALNASAAAPSQCWSTASTAASKVSLTPLPPTSLVSMSFHALETRSTSPGLALATIFFISGSVLPENGVLCLPA